MILTTSASMEIFAFNFYFDDMQWIKSNPREIEPPV